VHLWKCSCCVTRCFVSFQRGWLVQSWQDCYCLVLSLSQSSVLLSVCIRDVVLRWLFWVRTCEASRFDSNSNRTSQFDFDSKVTCRFENFESDSKISNRPHMPCAVIPQTTLTHCSTKIINLCAVCSWDLCLQLHFTCSCTAVARAHTQLLHGNRHCKRLLPYSIRDSIRTEISDSQVPSFEFWVLHQSLLT